MENSSPVAGAGVDMVEGKESLINPYLKVGSPRYVLTWICREDKRQIQNLC